MIDLPAAGMGGGHQARAGAEMGGVREAIDTIDLRRNNRGEDRPEAGDALDEPGGLVLVIVSGDTLLLLLNLVVEQVHQCQVFAQKDPVGSRQFQLAQVAHAAHPEEIGA